MILQASVNGPGNEAHNSVLLRLGAGLHDGGDLTDGSKVFGNLHVGKRECKEVETPSNVSHMPRAAVVLSFRFQIG